MAGGRRSTRRKPRASSQSPTKRKVQRVDRSYFETGQGGFAWLRRKVNAFDQAWSWRGKPRRAATVFGTLLYARRVDKEPETGFWPAWKYAFIGDGTQHDAKPSRAMGALEQERWIKKYMVARRLRRMCAHRGNVIEDVFRHYDSDNSGELDIAEFQMMLVSIGVDMNKKELGLIVDDLARHDPSPKKKKVVSLEDWRQFIQAPNPVGVCSTAEFGHAFPEDLENSLRRLYDPKKLAPRFHPLYTVQSLARRDTLKFNALIRKSLDFLWKKIDLDKSGRIENDEYIIMHFQICQVMADLGKLSEKLAPNGKVDEHEQLRVAQEDWIIDTQGFGFIDYTRFVSCWFQIADQFTDSITVKEYDKFLRRVIARLFPDDPDRPPETDEDSVESRKKKKKSVVPDPPPPEQQNDKEEEAKKRAQRTAQAETMAECALAAARNATDEAARRVDEARRRMAELFGGLADDDDERRQRLKEEAIRRRALRLEEEAQRIAMDQAMRRTKAATTIQTFARRTAARRRIDRMKNHENVEVSEKPVPVERKVLPVYPNFFDVLPRIILVPGVDEDLVVVEEEPGPVEEVPPPQDEAPPPPPPTPPTVYIASAPSPAELLAVAERNARLRELRRRIAKRKIAEFLRTKLVEPYRERVKLAAERAEALRLRASKFDGGGWSDSDESEVDVKPTAIRTDRLSLFARLMRRLPDQKKKLINRTGNNNTKLHPLGHHRKAEKISSLRRRSRRPVRFDEGLPPNKTTPRFDRLPQHHRNNNNNGPVTPDSRGGPDEAGPESDPTVEVDEAPPSPADDPRSRSGTYKLTAHEDRSRMQRIKDGMIPPVAPLTFKLKRISSSSQNSPQLPWEPPPGSTHQEAVNLMPCVFCQAEVVCVCAVARHRAKVQAKKDRERLTRSSSAA